VRLARFETVFPCSHKLAARYRQPRVAGISRPICRGLSGFHEVSLSAQPEPPSLFRRFASSFETCHTFLLRPTRSQSKLSKYGNRAASNRAQPASRLSVSRLHVAEITSVLQIYLHVIIESPRPLLTSPSSPSVLPFPYLIHLRSLSAPPLHSLSHILTILKILSGWISSSSECGSGNSPTAKCLFIRETAIK